MNEKKDISNFLDLLACPVCKGGLVFEGEKLICKQCKKIFLVEESIPVLIKEKAEELKNF